LAPLFKQLLGYLLLGYLLLGYLLQGYLPLGYLPLGYLLLGYLQPLTDCWLWQSGACHSTQCPQATRDRSKVKTEGGKIIRVEAHPIPEHPRPRWVGARAAGY